MSKKPLISIIIPIYNAENYIGKTIESFINQSFKNFELIMVNDGSKDDSVKIAKKKLEKSNLQYKLIDQENMGVSGARNTGIEEVNGDYILFFDDDDFIKDNYFNNIVEVIKKKDLDALFWGYDVSDEDGNIFRKYEQVYSYIDGILPGKKVVEKLLKGELNIRIGSCLFNKKIILNNNFRFIKNIRYGEDQEFHTRVLLKCERVASIKESKMVYLKRKNSASYEIAPYRLDALKAYEILLRDLKKQDEYKKAYNLLKHYYIPKAAMNIYKSYYFSNKKIPEDIYVQVKKFLGFYKIRYIFLNHRLFIRIFLLKFNLFR